MSKPENPPAFPRDHRWQGNNGMTLRDWFAGQALVGVLAGNDLSRAPTFDWDVMAKGAYGLADAMLVEREK
jgi:hypothetical protein